MKACCSGSLSFSLSFCVVAQDVLLLLLLLPVQQRINGLAPVIEQKRGGGGDTHTEGERVNKIEGTFSSPSFSPTHPPTVGVSMLLRRSCTSLLAAASTRSRRLVHPPTHLQRMLSDIAIEEDNSSSNGPTILDGRELSRRLRAAIKIQVGPSVFPTSLCPPTHTHTCSPTHPLTYLPTYSFTHPPIHPSTHPLSSTGRSVQERAWVRSPPCHSDCGGTPTGRGPAVRREEWVGGWVGWVDG